MFDFMAIFLKAFIFIWYICAYPIIAAMIAGFFDEIESSWKMGGILFFEVLWMALWIAGALYILFEVSL